MANMGKDKARRLKKIDAELSRAVEQGSSVEVVERLLADGADPNVDNANGKPVVLLAVQMGRFDMLRRLIQAGADVNSADRDGETPAIWAAGDRDFECLRILVDAGADVSKCNSKGMSATDFAKSIGPIESIEVILEAEARAGLNVRLMPSTEIRTLNKQLFKAIESDDVDEAADLINEGAQINASWGWPTNWRTPLYVAVFYDSIGCLGLLIDLGADVDLPSQGGYTPAMEAASEGKAKFLKMLILAGANLDLTDTFGRTAAKLAADYKHDDCLALIREVEASIEASEIDVAAGPGKPAKPRSSDSTTL